MTKQHITSLTRTLEQRYQAWLQHMDMWCELPNGEMPRLEIDDVLFALRGQGRGGVRVAEGYEWMQGVS